jgi:hypothetical protein
MVQYSLEQLACTRFDRNLASESMPAGQCGNGSSQVIGDQSMGLIGNKQIADHRPNCRKPTLSDLFRCFLGQQIKGAKQVESYQRCDAKRTLVWEGLLQTAVGSSQVRRPLEERIYTR